MRLPAIAAAFAALCPAALFAATPAAQGSAETPPELSFEQATLLRCSAAFAIIASEQGRGNEAALAYPALQDRGKEYFVRTGAQLMDELQLSREEVRALLAAEVGKLQAESGQAQDPAAAVDAVMQPCLLSLEASGL